MTTPSVDLPEHAPSAGEPAIERALAALAAVDAPPELAHGVMAIVSRDQALVGWRWVAAAGCFGVWGLSVHQIITWTLAQVQGVS